MSAKAPYNFVPLHDRFVESDLKDDEIKTFDTFPEKCHSGLIEFEIEAKTPIYIRNTKLSKENVSESDKKHFEDFFSPGGNYTIPGSSIRGMLRSFIETVSYGKFENYDNKKLYYRSIKHQLYKAKMIAFDRTRGASNKTCSGLLKKEGLDWVIYPSKKGQNEKNTQFYRVNFNSISRELSCNPTIKPKEFEIIPVDFVPVPPQTNYKHSFPLYYALVTKVNRQSHPTPNGYLQGYLISSGDLGNKKHMHWIINLPDVSKSFKVDKEVKEYYEKDESRDERSNLSAMLKNNPSGVPCFYLLENGKITALGFTAYFRLPYDTSIRDHVKINRMYNNTDRDIVESMFGKVDENSDNTIASRIFVEDFHRINLDGQKLYAEEESKIPKVLNAPKPTSFQLYLEQTLNNPQPQDWSSDNKIRGYKYYWHRNVTSASDWSDENPEHLKVHTEKIRPLASGNQFKGRIRFENLSDIELGALLFALNLPENCMMKIGLAKPYGLGSIQFSNTVLILKNPKNRYVRLFDQACQNWEKGLTEESNQKQYYEDFCIYILKSLGQWNEQTNQRQDAIHLLWSLPRMKELRCLLDWNNTQKPHWNEKTDYMILNCSEYKNREKLPKPSDVVKP